MCHHTENLNNRVSWYWGYLHSNGSFHIERLMFSEDGDCPLCYTKQQVENGNPNIAVLIDEPIQAKGLKEANVIIAYKLGQMSGEWLRKGKKPWKKPTRFELIDYD